MDLDRLELIRRLCVQIPAPRQRLVRFYGWYSNRARGVRGEVRRSSAPADMSPEAVARRRSWAQLLRKILEVDRFCARSDSVLIQSRCIRWR